MVFFSYVIHMTFFQKIWFCIPFLENFLILSTRQCTIDLDRWIYGFERFVYGLQISNLFLTILPRTVQKYYIKTNNTPFKITLNREIFINFLIPSVRQQSCLENPQVKLGRLYYLSRLVVIKYMNSVTE